MVSFKSGEVRGCTGCHESRSWTTDPHAALPAALRRPPDRPAPPPWGAQRLLGYEWLVQPILDPVIADDPADLGDIQRTVPKGDTVG